MIELERRTPVAARLLARAPLIERVALVHAPERATLARRLLRALPPATRGRAFAGAGAGEASRRAPSINALSLVRRLDVVDPFLPVQPLLACADPGRWSA